MTTEQLEAFIAVAERRHLTEAARRLGLSQPAVTRQLQALERELGARLFVRTSRGVHLTEPGQRFLAHARAAFDGLREGVAELHELTQSPRGAVSLGVLPTVGAYLLPALVQAFVKEHPDVALRITEALPEALEERIADGEVELAIIDLPLRRQDLVAQKLWEEPYLLAVPRGHRLAKATKPVPLGEVVGEPLVVIPGTTGTAALRAACEARGERPRFALEVDHPESLRRMVERGIGIALLPELMLREPRAPGLVALPVEGGLRRSIALAHRGERSLTSSARALKRFVAERLKAAPEQR